MIRLAFLSLLATPALAQDPFPAPCLAPQPDIAAAVTAMESHGWAQAMGEARDRALLGTGQLYLLAGANAETLGTIAPIEDLAAFDSQALALARDLYGDAATLVRGDASAVLAHEPFGPDQVSLLCIVTGPSLPGLDALVDGSDLRIEGDLSTVPVVSDPPPGATYLNLTAYRYEPKEPAGLLARQAVTVRLMTETPR